MYVVCTSMTTHHWGTFHLGWLVRGKPPAPQPLVSMKAFNANDHIDRASCQFLLFLVLSEAAGQGNEPSLNDDRILLRLVYYSVWLRPDR